MPNAKLETVKRTKSSKLSIHYTTKDKNAKDRASNFCWFEEQMYAKKIKQVHGCWTSPTPFRILCEHTLKHWNRRYENPKQTPIGTTQRLWSGYHTRQGRTELYNEKIKGSAW